MDKMAQRSSVGDCEQLERLLACIGVERWVDISGRRGDGCRALDEVCRTMGILYPLDRFMCNSTHREV